MKLEEIRAMQPGGELSYYVAKDVMGQQVCSDEIFGYLEITRDPIDGSPIWVPIQPYSEVRSVAQSVVDKMVQMGNTDALYWAKFGGGKYTEAEAICKAALAFVWGEKNSVEPGDLILRALFEEHNT